MYNGQKFQIYFLLHRKKKFLINRDILYLMKILFCEFYSKLVIKRIMTNGELYYLNILYTQMYFILFNDNEYNKGK